MDFKKYQELSSRTLRHQAMEHRDVVAMACMGLAGEVGEVLEPIKKHLFHGKELDRYQTMIEIGDCLWYAAALCTELGISLDEAAEANVAKLLARYPDGST